MQDCMSRDNEVLELVSYTHCYVYVWYTNIIFNLYLKRLPIKQLILKIMIRYLQYNLADWSIDW